MKKLLIVHSSWETMVHKNMIKSGNKLGGKLGKLDKEELLNEGILSRPLIKV